MIGRVLSVRDIPFESSAKPDHFERVGEGHYRFTATALNTDVEVERVRVERGALVADVTVHTGLAGAKTFGTGVLFNGAVNLSQLRDRDGVVRQLRERTGTTGGESAVWRAMVDELCWRVSEAEREGAPAVRLKDVVNQGAAQWHSSHGFALPASLPAMIFGDGDALKTYTSDAIALDLAWQGLNVALLDWEMSEQEHHERAQRLCGAQPVPEQVVYLNCTRPLVHERDRIATMLHDHDIDYVICDSAGFACHDKPEAADAALVYFREVRRLGVGSLHIAHMTKGEGGDQKPFGSAFWFNSVRALWYAKRADPGTDPATVEVGFYPRKFNLGKRRETHALQFTFGAETVHVQTIQATDVESLALALPLRERIRQELRGGALTMAEIATRTAAKLDSVKKSLNRNPQGFMRIIDTPDGIHRYGLGELWRVK